MKLEALQAMDAEDFNGLKGQLELIEGARVLLTANLWTEAGLMNGALGWCRGYIWPEGVILCLRTQGSVLRFACLWNSTKSA